MDEKDYLRKLAFDYMALALDCKQEKRRDLWRNHNSFVAVDRVPIYVRAFAWNEMPQAKLVCQNKVFRYAESFFQQSLFRNSFNDDFILEPWITLKAVHKNTSWCNLVKEHPDVDEEKLGAFKVDYLIKSLEDTQKIIHPEHEIDEIETTRCYEELYNAIGDIITINLDRGPTLRMWSADISTYLGYMRGIENIMLDMYDEPERLHKLLAFMRNKILEVHEKAEKDGDWNLSIHENQAMPYAKELKDPKPNINGVMRKELWYYMASQEYTSISPDMFDEFLLQYQLPILEKFGLVAYGCCEDLTNKISLLKKIPNLRRIAISPFANVEKCAEQIGSDYIASYRPSPSDMVSYDFNPTKIRKIVKRDFDILRSNGVTFDITLKDVETVEKDSQRIKKWVEIIRDLA